MIIKVSEAEGIVLDYLVAISLGGTDFSYDTIATYWIKIDGKDRALAKGWAQAFLPSTNWAHGGPIVDSIPGSVVKNWMECGTESKYEAHIHNYEGNWIAFGPTELIARLRVFVMMKLGEEAEVPNGLCR